MKLIKHGLIVLAGALALTPAILVAQDATGPAEILGDGELTLDGHKGPPDRGDSS